MEAYYGYRFLHVTDMDGIGHAIKANDHHGATDADRGRRPLPRTSASSTDTRHTAHGLKACQSLPEKAATAPKRMANMERMMELGAAHLRACRDPSRAFTPACATAEGHP